MNRPVAKKKTVHIWAIDCCDHAVELFSNIPASSLTSYKSEGRISDGDHESVDVIIVGVSKYPVRRLFISDLRRIYPHVPVLILRREEGPQTVAVDAMQSAEVTGRIRGEFLLSDSSTNDDYGIVRALRQLLPLVSCSHSAKGDNYETVRRVMRIIGQRYKEPRLNLEHVAEELAISKVNLSRILNQQAGISFRELLRNARIEEAKRMLGSGGYSIKEVAARVGFPDSHYFSRSFKKVTGVSASDYRLRDPIFG